MAAIFRISSLAALTAAALAPVFVFLDRPAPSPWLCMALFMAVLIFIRHHENIRRLLKGEEPRIGGQEGREAATRLSQTAPSAATGCGWPAPRTSARSPSTS